MKNFTGRWFSYSALFVQVATIGLGIILMNGTALGIRESPGVSNIASIALVLPVVVHIIVMMLICLSRGQHLFQMPWFLRNDHGQLLSVLAMVQQMVVPPELAPFAHPSIRPLFLGLYFPALTVAVLGLLTYWQNRVVAQNHGLTDRQAD